MDEGKDPGQDTTDEVAGSDPDVEGEAETEPGGVSSAANQTPAQAADGVQGATGEMGGEDAQAADGVQGATGEIGGEDAQAAEATDEAAAAAQEGTNLQAGTFIQATNTGPGNVSDLDTLAAAGNDVLGEPPGEASDGDRPIGDPPAPWWLPVTGSQWLVFAGVVATILIALGAGLVSARRRRRNGRAGWAR